jgi:predicted DNA-binding protein
MKKIRFTTYIAEDIKLKLEELSKVTRVPQAQYVQEAIEDLLRKYEESSK